MSSCSRMMDFFSANFMLQAPPPPADDNHHQPPSSLSSILPTCTTPQDFHGIAPMLGKRSMSFSGIDAFHQEANGGYGGEEDNLSDDGSQAGEIKKRRLNMEQVKTLEKSFEMGNKLEPERKIQLAKALGLQPRQIAIWFQNRRARWKTKTLEKDYEILKRQFEALKADNDSLLAQNQQLQSELSAIRGREPTESINLNKDTDQGSSSNRSENSSDIKLDISTRASIDDDLQNQPTTNRAFFQPRFHFSGPGSSRAELQGVKEESFTAMFTGIDDQPAFWPWIEQHNFN